MAEKLKVLFLSHPYLESMFTPWGDDVVAAVGEFVPALEAYRSVLGDRLVTADAVDELGAALGPRLETGDLVVLKASRGVALEAILPYLLDREPPPDG